METKLAHRLCQPEADEGTEASAQSVSAGTDEGTGASVQPVSAGTDEGTGASAQPASSGTGNAQIDGAAADTNLLAGAAVASEPGQAVADGGTANPATAAASNTGASDSVATGEDARLTMAGARQPHRESTLPTQFGWEIPLRISVINIMEVWINWNCFVR